MCHSQPLRSSLTTQTDAVLLCSHIFQKKKLQSSMLCQYLLRSQTDMWFFHQTKVPFTEAVSSRNHVHIFYGRVRCKYRMWDITEAVTLQFLGLGWVKFLTTFLCGWAKALKNIKSIKPGQRFLCFHRLKASRHKCSLMFSSFTLKAQSHHA